MKRALLLLLALTACTFGGNQPEINVHTGSEGLVITLEPTPAKVTSGDPFAIIGVITNKGAADVDNGVLSIGVEDDYIAMEGARTRPLRLFGRSALSPLGETSTLRLDMTAKQLPRITETVTSTILLTMCYSYTTFASATACVDPDLEHLQKNKPCTTGSVSMGGGQGAPVGVSNVQATMLPHTDKTRITPQFTITIDNIGKGDIVPRDKLVEACTGKAVGAIETVGLKAYLADKELTCTGDGEAKLGRNRNIRCHLPEGIEKAGGAYSTILRIELSYGYAQSTTKQVQIVRTP